MRLPSFFAPGQGHGDMGIWSEHTCLLLLRTLGAPEQGQDSSLYDKPTHLLFTGIRNWRICRCYSVPQWSPARLPARMAAHFHFSRPHKGRAP